jgi:hypothetical protein
MMISYYANGIDDLFCDANEIRNRCDSNQL